MSTLPQNDPLAQVAELARADLASRLQIDPALIEVVVAERVTWPDGSLGCPQPGRFYTQALVEGFRVVLGTGGRTRVYVYHAGSDGAAFLCPSSAADGGHDFVPPPGFDT